MGKGSKRSLATHSGSRSVSTTGTTAKTSKQRPPTRSIVRWNDDLDRRLLLSIQSACNSAGIRIPWAQVAELMGDKITDGAIVQHLAKLRSRLEEGGVPVPPPLRRGGVGSSRKNGALIKTDSQFENNWEENEQPEKVFESAMPAQSKSNTSADSLSVTPNSEDDLSDQQFNGDIATGKSFLTFMNTRDLAAGASWGIKRKASESAMVVLRVAPAKLAKIVGEGRPIGVSDILGEETQEKAVKIEDVDTDDQHPAHIQGGVAEADEEGQVPQALMHVGAQHYPSETPWIDPNILGIGNHIPHVVNQPIYSAAHSNGSVHLIAVDTQPAYHFDPAYLDPASEGMHAHVPTDDILVQDESFFDLPGDEDLAWIEQYGSMGDVSFQSQTYVSPRSLQLE